MPSDPSPVSDAEKLARLRLIRSDRVGPVSFRQLLARYGTAEKALEALPTLAQRGGAKQGLRIATAEAAKEEWQATEAAGGQFLFLGEAGYPASLAAVEDAPPVLIVKGHPHILENPMVSIVGARNASALGQRFAERLARDLGQEGIVVVSGLARGIDTAAHKGALEAGTAAVLAGGIDVIYPPENADMYESIAASGALVTEMPWGTQPRSQHFPRRNRIVSGLTLGVTVVEAAPRSGSLITARLAGEQGREVFAVPGSPLDPRAKGTNRLIRDGATLVDSAADIMDVLRPHLSGPASEPETPYAEPAALAAVDDSELDAAREIVKSKLGPSPVEIDELVRQCELTAAVVSTILLELELAGLLDRQPGGKVALLNGA